MKIFLVWLISVPILEIDLSPRPTKAKANPNINFLISSVILNSKFGQDIYNKMVAIINKTMLIFIRDFCTMSEDKYKKSRIKISIVLFIIATILLYISWPNFELRMTEEIKKFMFGFAFAFVGLGLRSISRIGTDISQTKNIFISYFFNYLAVILVFSIFISSVLFSLFRDDNLFYTFSFSINIFSGFLTYQAWDIVKELIK